MLGIKPRFGFTRISLDRIEEGQEEHLPVTDMLNKRPKELQDQQRW